jgi:transcriptional regulator with XRE-family HTH domain
MDNKNEPNVGLRLRFLREQKGLSLRALAERCRLSINAISQIERGENSPTVSSLHRLAIGLDVPITDFFQEENLQTMILVKRDQGLRAQSNGVVMESLGIGLSNQQVEPFRMKIEPGIGNINDPISHSGEEFVHCLDGVVEYFVDDRVVRLEQGDSLLFNALHRHAYFNSSQHPATILIVFQASRDFDGIQKLHL